jgi:hypothetical protein
MNSDKPANPSASERTRNTPGTDMQDEDAGTAASGNPPRRTPAESAMKQSSKTPSERRGSLPTGGNSGD